MNDAGFIRRALRLAARAKGNTSPNPMVGALVVRDGEIVGEGHHRRVGAPHAEREALDRAGERARGATLFVTLEPCAHSGRTAPCVDAIIAAGVARVVVPIEDPDTQVRGRGIRRLREAGIAVDVGPGEAEARKLNRAYIHHRITGRPFVTLKMAQSLDGAVAPRRREKMQLTGNAAAAFVRRLRIEHDAVMIGVATVQIDDPELTVRPYKRRDVPYMRIVVDSGGRMPLSAKLVRDQSRARTLVATTDAMEDATRAALEGAGVEVLICGRDESNRVDVDDLLRRLGERGVMSVLCEGGPTLAGALLRARHVQELRWLIAPCLIASADAVPVVAASGPLDLRVDIWEARRLGDDLLISGTPKE